MGVVQYRNSVLRAKEAVLQEDLFRMRDAIDQYYADKAKYPLNLDALVSEGYIRAVPKDPITNATDSWQTTPAEPDPNNPSGEIGIYNVHSGSEATALDGTKYSRVVEARVHDEGERALSRRCIVRAHSRHPVLHSQRVHDDGCTRQ